MTHHPGEGRGKSCAHFDIDPPVGGSYDTWRVDRKAAWSWSRTPLARPYRGRHRLVRICRGGHETVQELVRKLRRPAPRTTKRGSTCTSAGNHTPKRFEIW